MIQPPIIPGLSSILAHTDVESKPVLKAAARAHRALAELKGKSGQIPNAALLVDSLILREAKESSEIENIVTTHDELFKTQVLASSVINPAAKEVARYAAALKHGFAAIQSNGLLNSRLIAKLQSLIVNNDAGLRKQAGTNLKNPATGEVIYVPPQNPGDIIALMNDLEQYIHTENDDVDPLIRMALIHLRFEKIHPFYDGNGRTGRILNVLFLVKEDLLTLPILYLSRYIIRTKQRYYQLLRDTIEGADHEPWLLYMLEAVEITSKEALVLIGEIQNLILDTGRRLKAELPQTYSQDLLHNLFRHPYTKIPFVMEALSVKRVTAAKRLDRLVAGGFVEKHKVGRDNYYVNRPLIDLLVTPRIETPSSDADHSSVPTG